ncbi:MAG: YceI family protein [Propionibacteriales bacterium]|nr:YceI family protein [Propionibacteriales bacterium]
MTTGSASPIDVPAAGRYRIDPQQSTVSYSGRHMFGLGVVHATFMISSGELFVADPPTASTATVVIAADSFASGNARRDKDVSAASLLDVATYPTITFASDGLRPDGERWVLSGTVTAHGTTVPVEVMIDRVMQEGDGIRLHARAEHLDRYDFGISKSKGMVGRYLDLDFDIFARPV